ncbi:MAG: restriction endonuclease subunit S [Burkholderiales bacterium]|nr:restriction endonuclease subunit S [Burkholderiales bacterium]
MSAVSRTPEEGLRRRFKPYPSYKVSGIEWLGEMPADWEAKRLKNCVQRLESGGTPESDNFEYWTDDESGVPWVAISDMTRSFHIHDTAKRLTDRGLHSKHLPIVPSGTLLYSMYASLGKVALLEIDAAVNQAILGVVTRNELVLRDFLRWWLEFMQNHVQLLSSSNTQDNLNADKVRKMPVFVPRPDEQRAIAAFLDRETARIDALVAKKERLIELLQEKRTALITRAVTKGLDPTVPMKDSGVEWLGEIPAHWDVNRTKFAARLRSGHTPSRQHPEYWVECTIPWFGLADVWQIRDGQVEYVYETSEKISELGLANSAARLLPKGTVMLSRTASVGFSAIMGVDMATTQDFANWVCGPTLRAEYMLYVFRSMQHEFRRLTMGSTHQTIYMPDVGRFSAPIPPLPEQELIVSVIRKEAARIDTLIAKIRDAIERLKELRTALISAAVTGKIDVRKEAA